MVEEKIKKLIISRYGSVKTFAKKIKIPYTTMDTILRRGLMNSNALNVIKICKELKIDIYELTNDIVAIKVVL